VPISSEDGIFKLANYKSKTIQRNWVFMKELSVGRWKLRIQLLHSHHRKHTVAGSQTIKPTTHNWTSQTHLLQIRTTSYHFCRNSNFLAHTHWNYGFPRLYQLGNMKQGGQHITHSTSDMVPPPTDEVTLCDTGKLVFCTCYLTEVPATWSAISHGIFEETSKVQIWTKLR
jgi:hypothetical protein